MSEPQVEWETFSQKGRKQLRETPTLTCDLHTCTHVNMYSHTQYTLGRGILMCTISLSFSFFPFFPFLLFFLFPSFFFLHLSSFLFFIFFLTECFFLSRPNWSQTLNSPASPPQCVSPGTSHKPVSCLLACNSSCFPLENQKTVYKLNHPTAGWLFPLGSMILRFPHWVKWTFLRGLLLPYLWTPESSQSQKQPSAFRASLWAHAAECFSWEHSNFWVIGCETFSFNE